MSETAGVRRSIVREPLISIACSDVAGQFRGKGFPAKDIENRRRFGVGWTPANVMINCFGAIHSSPFGARGDLMMLPVEGGDIVLDYDDGSPVEHMVIGEIRNLDGSPWECCTRAILERALDRLEREGLRLVAAFEHEFWIHTAEERTGDAYSVGRLRGLEAFAGDLIGALRANGVEPDTFLPEFGPRQFEVTNEPSVGMKAADDAVKLREICRSVGKRHGQAVSFSPVVGAGIVGSGVHIHFSFTDLDGKPISYDPDAQGGLSRTMGSFAAGVLKHARALCALVAPSVISYERLRPNAWSAFCANLAYRDREAFLRICPYPEAEDVDIAERYNLEFRPGDATASPYLQLGALVHAGLEGLVWKLPSPPLSRQVPSELTPEERAAAGLEDLPHTLGEALDALEADQVAMGWLGATFSEAYLMHKRGEIAMAAALDLPELCRRFSSAY